MNKRIVGSFAVKAFQQSREACFRGRHKPSLWSASIPKQQELRKQKPRGEIPTGFLINLAIPTFASALTIIGPGCLTTVFGMGTGVSTWVCSPEKRMGRSGPHALDVLVF